MPRLYTQAEIQTVEKKEGAEDTYEVIVSSGKVDRLGDTIDPKGWYLKNYNKNPVILWSHSSGGWGSAAIPPVGRAIKTWNDEENNDLRQKQVFASTPFAQELKTLVDEKCLNAQSVGFIPLAEDGKKGDIEIEGKMYRRVLDAELKQYVEKGSIEIDGKEYSRDGQHFTKQELLEVSWVDVPALPSALVQARKRNLSLVVKALESMEKREEKGEEKVDDAELTPEKKSFIDRLEQIENNLSKLEEAIVSLKGDNPGESTSNGEQKGRKSFVKQKSKKSDVERLLIIFDKMCESLLRKLRQSND